MVCNGQPYFVSGFLNEAQTDPAQAQQQQECNSNEELIKVDQPRVYYGEQTREEANDYAIVGSTSPDDRAEFDRPGANNTDTYYTYTGSGGIPIGSLTRRLLYAVKNAETNFLLSDAVNDNSRLMYVRDPRSRVEKVAPFLTIDGDPYPSVVDGKIVWILDGYTTSATYPYSQRINLQTETEDATTGVGAFALAGQDVNYMRNSVKATVDAYDGTVTLYEFDTQDPVLKAWNKAFGGDLVKPKSEIPAALAEHLRYPVDLFKVQRNLLSKFHVTDPGGYFTGDDFWAVPNTPGQSDSQTKQPPYYLNTQLGEQQQTTFQLTAALSPAKRQNLARSCPLVRRGRQPATAGARTTRLHARARPGTGLPADDHGRRRANRDQPADRGRGGPDRLRQPAVAAVRRRHTVRRADLRAEQRRERVPAAPEGVAVLRRR